MKHTIDDINFKEKEYKKIILDFLKKKENEWVSIPEITLATGLQQNWIEYALRLLMRDYPCEVSINKGKQAIYLFDIRPQEYGSKRILQYLSTNIRKFTSVVLGLVSDLLLWSFVAISMILYMPSYMVNALVQVVIAPIFKYIIDFERIEAQTKKYEDHFFGAVIGKRFNESGGSLMTLLSTFGVTNKKTDKFFTERKLLQYASFREGKLTLSEIIQLTGWDLHTSRLAATKMVGIYNGEIQVSQNGIVVYVFEDLSQDQPGIMYIPKTWHSLGSYKVLTSLSSQGFWKMIRIMSLTAFYHCIFTVMLLLFFIIEAESITDVLIFSFLLATPLFLISLCYLVMLLRFVVYQIQNITIHKKNILKRIIKHITEQRGDKVYFKDFEKEPTKRLEKIFMALGGMPQTDKDGQMYFYFEEFALVDYPLIEHYQKVNLYDRFDGKSGLEWSIGENENRKLAYQDNYYYFEHKRSKGSWITQYHLPFDNAYKYFKIEAKIEVLTIENPENYCGIIWDATSDLENYYEFTVSNLGDFDVSECVKGKAAYYRREKTEHILAPPAINTLTLEQYADIKGKLRWRFSINHYEVVDMAAQKTLGDRIGFVLGNKISVAIHELLVTESIPSDK